MTSHSAPLSTTSEQDAGTISPIWEHGSPTPLSTHWMPLQELVLHWMDAGTLLYPIPMAPLLSAVGHALFALSHESRALRLWNQAAPCQQHDGLPALIWQQRADAATRHLHEAAQHWSRAASLLESLPPTSLDAAALSRVRQLSRIARTQQARLWTLTGEVQADMLRRCVQDADGTGTPVRPTEGGQHP